MGVTIHFEGQLSSGSYDDLIRIAMEFAIRNNMEYTLFEEDNKTLLRVKDEQDWNHVGPTKGIKIQPDINSDPMLLEFDKDNYIQEYCKTQFASTETHIKIIELLKLIEPSFDYLYVIDEGEYWESENTRLLQQHLDNCFTAIEEAIRENENLQGPFRLPDGRIVDLMDSEK